MFAVHLQRYANDFKYIMVRGRRLYLKQISEMLHKTLQNDYRKYMQTAAVYLIKTGTCNIYFTLWGINEII